MPVSLTCEACGKPFEVPPSHVRRTNHPRRTCSRRCKGLLSRRPGRISDAALLAKLEDGSIPIPFSGCWAWMGALTDGGYGSIRTRGGRGSSTNEYVHRVSYRIHVGPIPDETETDHLCRVRCCWNPHHLECVTPSVNALRGLAPATLRRLAQEKAARTHCAKGHEFTTENTKMEGGKRRCVTCRQASTRLRYAQRTLSYGYSAHE